jgi:hypothetical protein
MDKECENCGGQGVDPGDDGTGTFLCTICGGSGGYPMRISNWQSKLVEHWTGYIIHDEDGYAAVLYEGFGTYETLEEAEAYLKENDYEKVGEDTP